MTDMFWTSYPPPEGRTTSCTPNYVIVCRLSLHTSLICPHGLRDAPELTPLFFCFLIVSSGQLSSLPRSLQTAPWRAPDPTANAMMLTPGVAWR